MDLETLYCPNQGCRYYGKPFNEGRLVRNGSSHGQQQALCKGCSRSVSLRYGTAYYDLNAAPIIFETAMRALAEGNSLRLSLAYYHYEHILALVLHRVFQNLPVHLRVAGVIVAAPVLQQQRQLLVALLIPQREAGRTQPQLYHHRPTPAR